MLRAAAAILLVALLAGCAGGAAGPADAGGQAVAPGLALVRGVVVDQAIRPVPGVDVALAGGGVEQSAKTDAAGEFSFEVPPGAYQLRTSHFAYGPVTVAVLAEEGAQPPIKVLVERLFEQQAYRELQKFDGFIQCGYDATVISSLCANDYTRFVTDPQCPQCEHLLGDNRGTDFEVGAGWQTLVFEMTWEPPLQATSERMRLIVSHTPRVASHWYCSTSGPDPILLRMEVGVTCEDQQDDPDQVPPEGLPNMHLFAAVDAPPGQFAAVTFSQRFTVFMNFFYYGKPPEDWSFIRGDEPPF